MPYHDFDEVKRQAAELRASQGNDVPKLRGVVATPWMYDGKPSVIHELGWLHEQVLVLTKLVGELREEVRALQHDINVDAINRALGAELEVAVTMHAPPLSDTATR